MTIQNIDITSITPTICHLLGITQPRNSTSILLESVISLMHSKSIAAVEKCLIYAPDAMGENLYKAYPNMYEPVEQIMQVKQLIRSVFPPKTPVCFASMFTGALPDVHGIKKYEKPVLTCDTLFDALVRAGKKTAIAAVERSSIDIIFRDRAIDYYSEKYDTEVIERTTSLIKNNSHDLILSYNQEYDDQIHDTAPFSPAALTAAQNHIAHFIHLLRVCDDHWLNYNRLIMFTPDHGCHLDAERNCGDHGADIQEDMNIIHFYAVIPTGKKLFTVAN